MDTENFVYFELNNWFPGQDYPNAEPFITWCGSDDHLYFSDDNWVNENKIVVAATIIDMSANWCITAPKSWVLEHCPLLLSDGATTCEFTSRTKHETRKYTEEFPYSRYLRFPGDDDPETIYGKFGTQFLPYSDENIGIHWFIDDDEV